MFYRLGFCVVSQTFMSIKLRFFWGEYRKSFTSFMIGMSPELELALFTLAYKTRPNEHCRVSLGGYTFAIKTGISYGKLLRSAFFELEVV